MEIQPIEGQASGDLIGVGAALACFVLWGSMVLYVPLLDPASPLEIIGYRAVGTFAFVLVALAVSRRLSAVKAIARNRRQLLLLASAGLLIASNWGVYVWAVTHGLVVEVGLGFYLQPVIAVMLAVVVLHERLRRIQWVAVGIAAAAMVVLTIEYGHPPWVGILLGGSLAVYGLLRNLADAPALAAVLVETSVVLPIMVALLAWIGATGGSSLVSNGGGHVALLLTCGVVMGAPMLLFGVATRRVPLSTLGILQYVNPTVAILLGVLVLNEQITVYRLIGLVFVWVALALLAADALAHRRGLSVTAVEPT